MLGVLLTGMHRSGTSAVAQWVAALGIGADAVGDFPRNAANPTGLYEWQQLVAMNDRWLGVLGGSWWAPPRVKEQTWRSMSPTEIDSDREALPEFLSASRNWFVKDPRISLLLPLWDRLLLHRAPVILAVRSPREVALSLHLRNGITLRRGLALWAYHHQQVLRHLHGRPALLIDFESALAEPGSALQGLTEFLTGVGLAASPDRFHAVLGKVEPALRRQVAAPLDGTAERLARDVDDAYEHLRKQHLRFPAEFPAVTVPMPDWADEAIDELGEFWSVQVERDIARSEGDIARAERDIARAERDIARSEGDILRRERDDLVHRLQRNPLRRMVPQPVRAAVRARRSPAEQRDGEARESAPAG